jgi:hypothetical protein
VQAVAASQHGLEVRFRVSTALRTRIQFVRRHNLAFLPKVLSHSYQYAIVIDRLSGLDTLEIFILGAVCNLSNVICPLIPYPDDQQLSALLTNR